MNWLEVRSRPLQVESNELMNDFDMYEEAGTKLCGSGTANRLFGRKDGKRFKFGQSVISKELSKGIDYICRRSLTDGWEAPW
jgi:hypothetical protein